MRVEPRPERSRGAEAQDDEAQKRAGGQQQRASVGQEGRDGLDRRERRTFGPADPACPALPAQRASSDQREPQNWMERHVRVVEQRRLGKCREIRGIQEQCDNRGEQHQVSQSRGETTAHAIMDFN